LNPQATLIEFLLPLGLWLTLTAAAPRRLEGRAALAGLLALATATLCMVAAGFALMLGGSAPTRGLDASLAITVNGTRWAFAGWKGFGLVGILDALPGLIWALPLAQAAAMLAAGWAWRSSSLVRIMVLSALVVLAFALTGMWMWGGGLGTTLGHVFRLGHGPIDFGGLGVVGLIAGAASVAAARRVEPDANRDRLTESPNPLRAMTGGLLVVIGAAALQPGLDGAAWATYLTNLLMAALIAAVVAAGYATFTTRRTALDRAAAAAVAAAIMVSPGAGGLPTGVCAGLGVVAGLLVIVGEFVLARAASGDSGQGVAAVTRGVLPALIGFAAAGFFADGSLGAGWNAIGVQSYLNIAGMGVLGALAGDTGQLTAQLAFVGLAGVTAVVLGLPVRGLAPVALPALADAEAWSPEAEAATREAWASDEAPDLAVAAEEPNSDIAAEPEPVFAPRSANLGVEPTGGLSKPAQAGSDPEEPPQPTEVAPMPAPPPLQRARPEQRPVEPPTPPGAVPPQRAHEPTLLERLRLSRQARPKPAGQARRVAYPVRVGGRRVVMRAIPRDEEPPKAE